MISMLPWLSTHSSFLSVERWWGSQLIPLSRMLVGSKPAHNSCIILAEINIIPDFQLRLVKYGAAEGPEEKFFANCYEGQAPLFRDPTEPPTNFHSHHSQGEVYLRQ